MKARILNFATNVSHTFSHSIGNSIFKLHILYSPHKDKYVLNVDKLIEGKYVNIINSITLTTGVNLFLQYQYYGLGQLWIIPMTDDVSGEIPSSDTLQDKYVMFWVHD